MARNPAPNPAPVAPSAIPAFIDLVTPIPRGYRRAFVNGEPRLELEPQWDVTQERWTASVDEVGKRYQDRLIVHVEDEDICEIAIPVRGPTPKALARAHAIAAAPEMLAALKHARDNCMGHPDQLIDEAIAKAEGRGDA